jgi:hypothetical protein
MILVLEAQRLAAQPLGHFRHVVTILAGNLKPQFNVRSLSLGQVGCSRVLGGGYLCPRLVNHRLNSRYLQSLDLSFF